MAEKETSVKTMPKSRSVIGSVIIAISFDLYTQRLFKKICEMTGNENQSQTLNNLIDKINAKDSFKDYQEYLKKYAIIFAESYTQKNFWLLPQEITILDELTKKSGQNTKSKFVRSLIQYYAFLYDIEGNILLKK